MLRFLDNQREGDSKSRPIVFLGHCLGGLIIRQAIRFATKEKLVSIASATKSMMFFGTPHGGGDKKGWLKLAEHVGFGRKPRMIDDLTKKTDNLDNLDEDFCHLPIVNKMSAYKIAGESVFVGADHLKLCQFEDDDDSTFLRVCQVIKEAVLKTQGQGLPEPKVAAAVLLPSAQRPQAAPPAPPSTQPWY
ncbi:hypothetical protein F5Y19DRAFT_474742 [Xylariaceae sp. FL1651]|nr:hypothetical protein F5Y19DRAFT_474742 [Xylariaceae sp. FL1651]